MKSYNKMVALTPFPSKSVQTVSKGGLIVAEQASGLTQLQVVFDTEGVLKAGQSVWVRGNLASNPEWSNVHKIHEKVFVLIPETAIMLIE